MDGTVKNGQTPQVNQEHLVHGNGDLLTTPSNSVQVRFFTNQNRHTVGSIEGWGVNLQALEVTLQMALKWVKQQRTGIIDPT